MTVIIGAHCKDGIILVGDSKILRGDDWDFQSKIDNDVIPQVVFGAAGTTAFFDKFKRHIHHQTEELRASREEGEAPYDNIEQFLIACERILRFYKQEYEITPSQNPIELLIAINTGDTQTLHFLNASENITEEQIKKFAVIGHGEPYARLFMKKLWCDDFTMEQNAVLACSVIHVIEHEKLDVTVGGNPHIWFVPNGKENFKLEGDAVQKILNKRDDFIKELKIDFDNLKSFLRS